MKIRGYRSENNLYILYSIIDVNKESKKRALSEKSLLQSAVRVVSLVL